MSNAERILETDRAGSRKYRSADPPLVLQSKAHREVVAALLPFWTTASPAAKRAIGMLGACGTWNGRSYNAWGTPARYRCGQHICRHCCDRWKRKTARTLAKDVRDLSNSDLTNVRRVTLNLLDVSECEVAETVERQRVILSKLYERQLEQCALVGGFDFALKPNGRVMVHVHAALIGPSERLGEAENTLRARCSGLRSFSADQLRDRLNDDSDGPTTWLSYALDSAITAPKHNRKPDWQHHSLTTPEEKLRWVELQAALRNRKGNPIRLTIRLGVRRMKNRKQKLVTARGAEHQLSIFEQSLVRIWNLVNLVDWTWSGETKGGVYRYLFRQEQGWRASDWLARPGGQSDCSPGPGHGPADVWRVATWKTPARGPP